MNGISKDNFFPSKSCLLFDLQFTRETKSSHKFTVEMWKQIEWLNILSRITTSSISLMSFKLLMKHQMTMSIILRSIFKLIQLESRPTIISNFESAQMEILMETDRCNADQQNFQLLCMSIPDASSLSRNKFQRNFSLIIFQPNTSHELAQESKAATGAFRNEKIVQNGNLFRGRWRK